MMCGSCVNPRAAAIRALHNTIAAVQRERGIADTCKCGRDSIETLENTILEARLALAVSSLAMQSTQAVSPPQAEIVGLLVKAVRRAMEYAKKMPDEAYDRIIHNTATISDLPRDLQALCDALEQCVTSILGEQEK